MTFQIFQNVALSGDYGQLGIGFWVDVSLQDLLVLSVPGDFILRQAKVRLFEYEGEQGKLLERIYREFSLDS